MEIDLTTPALLFSAISLIMLAYTNRFLSYAGLVRAFERATSEESFIGDGRTDCQSAATALPDAGYAGNRHSKLLLCVVSMFLYLYPASSGIGLYLRPGIGAADYLAGNFGV